MTGLGLAFGVAVAIRLFNSQVGYSTHRKTTSIPCRTCPKTTCLPSSQPHGAVVRKNWLPLELGPELAMLSTYTERERVGCVRDINCSWPCTTPWLFHPSSNPTGSGGAVCAGDTTRQTRRRVTPALDQILYPRVTDPAFFSMPPTSPGHDHPPTHPIATRRAWVNPQAHSPRAQRASAGTCPHP